MPPLSLGGLLIGLAFASGCGRRATMDDCEQIVARIVELELKTSDASALKQAVARAQEELKGEASSRCVGRRIRTDALECVRRAVTPEELIDDCFDL